MTEGRALTQAVAHLAAAGIDEPRREARLLLALALGHPAESWLASSDRDIDVETAGRFASFVARRAGHEPYSRIAGKREFWSREFVLSPDTLDPRPDSETVIETALTRIPDRGASLQILDFGTGTGALLLALLSELPKANGTGIDIAPGAIATARRNAVALGLAARARFIVGHWGDCLSFPADVILANPPYVLSADLVALTPEVARFDPPRALDGGQDGLQAYRELAPDLSRLLRSTGFAVCEIGAGQAGKVARVMSRSGLELVAKRRDLAGIERCLVFEQRKKVGKSQNKGLMK